MTSTAFDYLRRQLEPLVTKHLRLCFGKWNADPAYLFEKSQNQSLNGLEAGWQEAYDNAVHSLETEGESVMQSLVVALQNYPTQGRSNDVL